MTAARLSRRDLLAGVGASLLLSACRGAAGDRDVLRIGLLPSLTHSPMLAALGSGRLARALAPIRIETRVFRAGPRVVEALMGGAIDVGVSGPAPVVIAQARHGDGTLRALSGVASGGASLVVAKDARVTTAADLHGRSVAVTQLGSTQDVSLRKYLARNGLQRTTQGGDVTVHVLSGADIRTQMMRGELAAAWVPEPWPTRLVRELGAVRLVDERDLWDGGRFSSAMMVARSTFADARATDVSRVVEVIADEVLRASRPDSESRGEAHAEIKRLTTNAGPRPLFDEAWTRVDFTTDPLERAVEIFAEDAIAMGIVPRMACRSLFTHGAVKTADVRPL